jgi:hypothetical protein
MLKNSKTEYLANTRRIFSGPGAAKLFGDFNSMEDILRAKYLVFGSFEKQAPQEGES